MGTGTASLTIQVFNDTNRDSQMNQTEKGITGVPVALILLDAQQGDAVAARAETDENGQVSFSALPAGTYAFGVTLPDNFSFTEKSQKKVTIKQNYMEQSSTSYAESPAMVIGAGEQVQTAAAGAEPGPAVVRMERRAAVPGGRGAGTGKGEAGIQRRDGPGNRADRAGPVQHALRVLADEQNRHTEPGRRAVQRGPDAF